MNFGSNTNLPLTPLNGDMSQATVQAGPFDFRSGAAGAVVASFSGAPNGTLTLLGTAQPIAPAVGSPNWIAMATPVTISAAGSYFWDVVGSGAMFLAVLYTRTSGTGTLSVAATRKA